MNPSPSCPPSLTQPYPPTSPSSPPSEHNTIVLYLPPPNPAPATSPSPTLNTPPTPYPSCTSNPSPTKESPNPKSYILVYLHGGAFRDPLHTAAEIEPSLPALFALPSSPGGGATASGETALPAAEGGAGGSIAAVIGINYRLAPYLPPRTSDTESGDEIPNGGRGTWPLHLSDVRDALAYLGGKEWAAVSAEKTDHSLRLGGIDDHPWLLAGHSVGATMALMLSLKCTSIFLGIDTKTINDNKSYTTNDNTTTRKAVFNNMMCSLAGVVALEGIYDFCKLRDRHWSAHEQYYEPWIRTVFGEDEGASGWERGNVLRVLGREEGRMPGDGVTSGASGNGSGEKWLRDGVKGVVVAHSRADEAVEIEQSLELVEALGGEEREGGTGRVRFVECEGGHDEVVAQGVEVGRCVGVLVDWLGEGGGEGG